MTEARPPRESSTVVVVRDGAEGLELFMVRRHLASDYIGGAFVFPGGGLEAGDVAPGALAACGGLAAGVRMDLAPERVLGHMVAAIRETFEEAGVLLASRDGRVVNLEEERDHWIERRRQLLDGEIGWGELVAAEGLTLACDRLGYWAHWITPETVAKRFTTRFFVAELPAGQVPLPDAREVDHGLWVTPKGALEAFERGEMTMIFPTLRTLEELMPVESAAALMAACEGREVVARLPRAVRRGEETVILLPGDEGYDEAGARPALPFDPARR